MNSFDKSTTTTVGDKNRFAIESGITKAYERKSFLALGYFVIFIGGQRYGVHAPDASLLACSFDEVEKRIARQGVHTAPFAANPDAGTIADAYRDAYYAPDQDGNEFFNFFRHQFLAFFFDNELVWTPDGDEAFDDWSYVLQFDVGDRVRLIGFQSDTEGYHHKSGTLRDFWLEADEFYNILQRWRDAFYQEWASTSKISELDDGAEPTGVGIS